jgi:hypothetical protein
MKTVVNRMNRSSGISLLNWPSVPSRVGEAVISHSKYRKHTRIPQLRIVSDLENDDLFQCATAAKSATEFWETIVYTAMALSAAGALAVAFGI